MLLRLASSKIHIHDLQFFRCKKRKTSKRRLTQNSANLIESSDDNWNFGRKLKSEGDTPENELSWQQ